MDQFKQCSNGHFYQGDTCPYCASSNHATSNRTVLQPGNAPTNGETVPYGGGTQLVDSDATVVQTVKSGSRPKHSGTVFGDDFDMTDMSNNESKGAEAPASTSRYSRKLVGWLVSYTLDELGVDYRLYEGRNIIGRNDECNITVDDGKVSGEHAVLLFRASKYSITDKQSSHGTFVNGEDIDLEPRYLKDGDVIRVGNTTFLFRTSLF